MKCVKCEIRKFGCFDKLVWPNCKHTTYHRLYLVREVTVHTKGTEVEV